MNLGLGVDVSFRGVRDAGGVIGVAVHAIVVLRGAGIVASESGEEGVRAVLLPAVAEAGNIQHAVDSKPAPFKNQPRKVRHPTRAISRVFSKSGPTARSALALRTS